MKQPGILISSFLFLTSVILHANPGGRVEKVTFYSQSLQVEKSFNIYLPQGYDQSDEHYPVLYVCRGGEDEWLNLTNIIELVDSMIQVAEIGKLILVFPGLTYQGNRMVGFPVNMNNISSLGERKGLGTGRFEDYFVKDLIPYLDDNYRTIPLRKARGIDGFSGGAVTSVLIGVTHPELFISVGAYDGPWGYLDFNDPSRPGDEDDSIWMNLSLFDPFFGNPRDIEFMKRYNSANIINNADGKKLSRLQELKFFIHSASKSAQSAYIEGTYYARTVHLVDVLASKGIENYWDKDSLILSPKAEHEFPDAQVHMKFTLPLHWKEFASHRKPK